jgi:outer membrane protein TolC
MTRPSPIRVVLDAERQLLAAEIDLTGVPRDQLTAVGQVYEAPGGSWELAPTPGEAEAR